MSEELKSKASNLYALLRSAGRIAIAFSGGNGYE
jgi:PP-loop superfamily ATP-utilizing enzyme